MESDLVQESFVKDFEKVPGYKASFEFKNKMFTSMRSQRTSLVPFFKLGDMVARVKMQVDDTLDDNGAVVILDDCPDRILWLRGGSCLCSVQTIAVPSSD